MVVGPKTSKDLSKALEDTLDSIDFEFEPIRASTPVPQQPPPPPPTPEPGPPAQCLIIKGSARRAYYIRAPCSDCQNPVDLTVKTSHTSIYHLHQLLTKDLQLLCSPCEQASRRRKRNGRR
ncbi:E7 [Camelus dromedarius papillomavirus 2]|uniref:E7 n=1 Tax=Camelus dromedarius papillomavirus 2 TaxID=996651 RepID=F2YGH6_9PAPI|nr:E7 [Camelus dromedarius papillomavirus 2]ADZ53059.1 E7 [Camelus dromedarius papillomavirus 2]